MAKLFRNPKNISAIFWLHFIAACLHLGQAIAQTILVSNNTFNYKQNVYGPLLPPALTPSDHRGKLFSFRRIGVDFDLSWFMPAFFYITFAAELAYTFGLRSSTSWLTLYLQQGWNPMRWIEYSISATLMAIAIGNLSGLVTLGEMMLMIGLTISTMGFGFLMEYIQTLPSGGYTSLKTKTARGHSWVPFLWGCVPALMYWIAVTVAFADLANTGNPPDFVFAVIITLALLWITFPIVAIWKQSELNKNKQHLFELAKKAEVSYTILSIVSKTALAWIIFGGTQ